MGKKKLFKRLLAVVMALVLSNVFTTVERAEAASCPPHGEYYDTLVYARTLTEKHDVKIRVYAEDQYGNKIDITDNLASPVYVTCTISQKQYYYEVRCKRCNAKMGSYDYRDPAVHSYCR